jgi:hypothetical protein
LGGASGGGFGRDTAAMAANNYEPGERVALGATLAGGAAAVRWLGGLYSSMRVDPLSVGQMGRWLGRVGEAVAVL